ncbi:DUF4173 domain-containing protein [Chryseobacterium sp.]|uniref:DUF4153 domain-containing protein n=1 Tax=Chryseobacterium sp. TaxID=1871047 RepID=UPI0012AA4C77|nr:DUF4173 domain-containing protein [Chryseobacterium sp.]QFG52416.1 DUF4173 domain-containing protein [Chryseobacterium sp.]
MKTHQLILLTTVLFVTLFYDEDMGLNLGILGISYALLTLFRTPEALRTRTFLLLFVLSILSGVSFAWYGDFASFLAVFTSLALLTFHSREHGLKSLFVIPVFGVNFITFIYRVFQFGEWLPAISTSSAFRRLIAVILIPAFFILAFFGIYSLGSTHFAGIFDNWEWNFDVWQFIVLTSLGFFIAFNFWNFKIYNFFPEWNNFLKNDFNAAHLAQKPTSSFLGIEAERTSGIISFAALNILLLIFIITFNFEQFFETPASAAELSIETHERVNAVILSIVMAVLVIMFYFKGSFNFDHKARPLKVLAEIWLALNVILVLSAFIKNSEYVLHLGLTYKRLGVYTFVILCIIGLVLTFVKIRKRKTNAYLFNHMAWYFYGTVLVAAFFNWGYLATSYNISNNKGSFEFHRTMNYNDDLLLEKYPLEAANVTEKVAEQKDRTFLSSILYYQTINY